MPKAPRSDDKLQSRVAVAGHPLHAMMVAFPIAFLIAVVGSDIAWIVTDDAFWARLSLWLIGAGAVSGFLAGIAGTIELLAIPGVRRRGVSWSHFVVAITLLSVAFTNWFWRLENGMEAVLPWGLALSLLGAALVGIAGWLGGNLVFEHQIGIVQEDGD
ncbi:MAG: DUF2231 domain-containing protein [Wenzhouxiangella sp.]